MHTKCNAVTQISETKHKLTLELAWEHHMFGVTCMKDPVCRALMNLNPISAGTVTVPNQMMLNQVGYAEIMLELCLPDTFQTRPTTPLPPRGRGKGLDSSWCTCILPWWQGLNVHPAAATSQGRHCGQAKLDLKNPAVIQIICFWDYHFSTEKYEIYSKISRALYNEWQFCPSTGVKRLSMGATDRMTGYVPKELSTDSRLHFSWACQHLWPCRKENCTAWDGTSEPGRVLIFCPSHYDLLSLDRWCLVNHGRTVLIVLGSLRPPNGRTMMGPVTTSRIL